MYSSQFLRRCPLFTHHNFACEYSQTPLNPYLLVDSPGYGLRGVIEVNFGVNSGLLAAKTYILERRVVHVDHHGNMF
jgi:hypothetical protein